MMTTPVSIIVLSLVALLINTLSYCSAESVYCVTPTATSCSSCPHNSIHCATLSEYAQEAELYFTSNTTMVLLPGDHVLDRTITVVNVARLTMRGESFSDNIATVVRYGLVGFRFTNMVNFNIYSLAFTSYNRSWSYGSHPASNSALLLQSTQNTKLVNCSFHDNIGTALTVHSTIIALAKNEFIHNQCGCESFSYYCKLGCGITALNSTLSFTGSTTFFKNSHNGIGASGVGAGAILALASSLHFTGTNNFIRNSAKFRAGAIYISNNSTVTFTGINNFTGNSVKLSNGGVIYTENTVLTFTGRNSFINNSAYAGGAIRTSRNAVFVFTGTNNFIDNSARAFGGAITTAVNISLSFTGTSSFSSNSATKGGVIYASFRSTVTFNGSVSFTNNGHNKKGSRGGAMYLFISATFSTLPHTTVHWENNYATLGGAIYVSDINPLIYCTPVVPLIFEYVPREECFFQLPGQNLSRGLNVQLVFKNNTADNAGSMLYGGQIDHCKLTGLKSHSPGEVFDMLVNNNDNTTSKISSVPLHVCPCENNLPDCKWSTGSISYPHTVYPGETFQVSVVATGQRKGMVSSTVRSTAITRTVHSQSTVTNNIDYHLVKLLDYQYLQHTNNTCTKLNYTVFSLSQEVKLNLHPEGSSCSKYHTGLLTISVTINQTCPPGFNISESARSCVCEPRLAKYTNQCNITNGVGQITRDSNKHFWIGYDNLSHELILHPYCPFDYCVNDAVVFSLNNTDMQCTYNRSGLLCGRCRDGYSLVLGTHQCKKCTNIYFLLFIPFSAMGVALVFLLLICKLTVATGTLSGLVFYANIFGVNRTIFLPVKSTDALSVFIAWLNLDFGIETCFYDGLDAYRKIWLQFVFPVYIWVLVGLMIFISHFSQRFANLLGSNPVSVLATLIFLSYAKILRTLIATVYFTHLEYPTYNRRVWLYDANIDYIFGKHIPLFLVAVLVFLILFLPYTLLLLSGQWLQTISHLRLFSWVNSARLKPFMDSYHAPYKAKHRYWPGLLLVLRCILLLVFAFNRQRDSSVNLLAIVVGAGILQLWAWVSGGVYKNWGLDALEGSFVLNLIVLSVATYHVQLSGGKQLAAGYTSISIAFTTFIGILTYHIFQQLIQTKLWIKVHKVNLEFKKLNTKQKIDNPVNDPTESANLDQLREPWLEDLLQPTHSSF